VVTRSFSQRTGVFSPRFCSYWEIALDGPWTENSSGTGKTTYTSAVIKAVLSYIYTAEIAPDLMEKNAMTIIAAANEYQLESLQFMAVQMRVGRVDVENLKETFMTAHLFGIEILKQACSVFVQDHWGEVLAHRGFVSLAVENPEIWDEFTAVIQDKQSRDQRPNVLA